MLPILLNSAVGRILQRWHCSCFIIIYFQPLTSCKIGSPCSKATINALMDPSLQTTSESKSRSPFKLLFRQSGASDPELTTIPVGTQDDVWGSPISIHGQIGSVCVFHDTLNPGQVKAMYTAGNHVTCHVTCGGLLCQSTGR